MNEIIYFHSCVHFYSNGYSSSCVRLGDTLKSMGHRDKRIILLSLSDSEGEAEDNDRFVLYLALHLNTDAFPRLAL